MKNGWVTKKLGEVCETFNGIWKGSKPPFRNVGVIRSTNFTKECGFDSRDEKTVFIDVEEKKFLKRKLRCGDIVVERSGGGPNQPVGRVLYFNLKDGDYTISNFTSALRVKDNGELDSYYLYRALCALYFSGVTAKMQGNSINIINLHFDEYLNLDIPIPPLSEQKRIVAKIDAAFEKIDQLKANAEKNLANAKELFQSALDEAMRPKKGWVEKRLGEVCETITDGDHQPPPKVASGVPFLVISDVSKGRLSFEDTRFVPEEYYAKIPEAKKPKIGDVLLTVTGSFGIPVLVDTEQRFCFQRHIALLRSNQMFPRFLVYQLSSHESLKYFDKVATGTAQRTVSLSSLRNMEIVVPPFAEQERIVGKIGGLKLKLDALRQNYSQQISDCAEMRQAILREAFEGRL